MVDYRGEFNRAEEDGLRGVAGESGCLYIADYILRRIEPPQNGRILDLGCGDGRVLRAMHNLRPDLYCVGVDFAEQKVAQANAENKMTDSLSFETKDLRHDDVESLGRFSRIFSFSVIQYLKPKEFVGLNRRLQGALLPDGTLSHLSIPDLAKRVVLFQNDFLNHTPCGPLQSAIHFLKMAIVDYKRRMAHDRHYGNSLFHAAEELAAISRPAFHTEIVRPSDSWYRFDAILKPVGIVCQKTD